jgi:hypothetical protein
MALLDQSSMHVLMTIVCIVWGGGGGITLISIKNQVSVFLKCMFNYTLLA